MADQETRTPEQITKQVANALDTLRYFQYDTEYTIEDYPIGGSERGYCKVGMEYKPGFGSRLVRTTGNKNGKWNKPHKSQYDNGLLMPVADICNIVPDLTGYSYRNGVIEATTGSYFLGGTRFVGWVKVSKSGIYLKRANYDTLCIFSSPRDGSPPRREPLVIPAETVTTRQLYSNEPAKVEEIPERIIPADSPEDIARYDAFIEATKEVIEFIKQVKAEVKARVKVSS